ncbi:Hypothetical predicted protein [Mytilus galloprovincialis]|uniref:Uncharacterized protein n=1 Tax=Mytilus galloprovincialis TaxID=29158 RepID=A0A8B6GS51_MYTGA|nr:Hypothetical predicted protein [Mytilus galloprovincialis]
MTKTVKKVSKRIDEVEKSMEFMNQNFESSKSESEYLKTTITEIKSEHGEMVNGFDCLSTDMDEFHERHVDLQIRSMRENLVFTGIPELSENEPSEQTEDFMKFQKEVNDRRKLRWPYYKEAKQQGQKTHFKRDKLFINGAEIGPPTDHHMETDKRQQQETEGARQKEPPRRGPQQNNDRSRGAPRRRGKHS